MIILQPKISEEIQEFLQEKKMVRSLVQAFGSPLNLVFPHQISENLKKFQATMAHEGVRGKVYFAHKTSQSQAFIRTLAISDACIDVASERELKNALSCGMEGKRIEATGPKSPEFLLLAVMHGVLISVDSVFELQQVVELAQKLGKKVAVLLRMSGFDKSGEEILKKESRFGIAVQEFERAIEVLSDGKSFLDFQGLAFHLDSIEVKEKVRAIEQCLELIQRLRTAGFESRFLNIGGGFKVNYLEKQEQWIEFMSQLKEMTMGQRENSIWHNQTFGLRSEKGVLRGSFNSYQFFETQVAEKYLAEILNFHSEKYGQRIADLIAENLLELIIEPGRAMADQCGITVAKVNFIKKSSKGNLLVGVGMKRSDLSFLDQEFFVDPIHISLVENSASNHSAEVFIVGNLCLETDVILKRKIVVKQIPALGDLFVFVNTAGYSMDFNSTASIQQNIAPKIVIHKLGEEFCFVLDENYYPTL